MSLASRLVAKHTKRLEGDLEQLKKQFPNPAVAYNICVWNELIKQAARLELMEANLDQSWCHKCCDDTGTWDGDCVKCNLSKPTGAQKGGHA